MRADKIGRISDDLTASSLPHSTHVDKASWPNHPFLSKRQYNSCLLLSSRFQFPTSPWHYSNKPITASHRNHRYLALLILEGIPSTDSNCSLLSAIVHSWVQPPHSPVWHAMFSPPGLWVHVTNQLLISSVQCWVLRVWPSIPMTQS